MNGYGPVSGVDDKQFEGFGWIARTEHSKIKELLRTEQQRLTSHFETDRQHEGAMRMGSVVCSYPRDRITESSFFIRNETNYLTNAVTLTALIAEKFTRAIALL